MSRDKRAKYFTRHLLRAGLQCPTKLYYKSNHYPEDTRIKPFLEHAGFNKYQLKKLLRFLYPDAKLISESSRKRSADVTAKHLQKQQVVLLDAAFIHERSYAKVPVLIKNGSQLTLVDLQTKAINPNKHSLTNHHGKLHKKWRPYIVYLAYKGHILQQLYTDYNFEMQLLLPDKTKKAVNDRLLQRLQTEEDTLDHEDLFCRLDVTEYVEAMISGDGFEAIFDGPFEEILEQLKDRFFNPKWQEPRIGKKCGNCEFRISDAQRREGGAESGFQHCWKESTEVPEFSLHSNPVLDLIGPGVNRWMEQGIFLQKNIPLTDLPSLQSITENGTGITQKQRQSLQVRQVKGMKIPSEIAKEPVTEEINRWQYPLHFLDFEAGNYAVPLRKNRQPYHLVVFQFSCHTLHADGRQSHHEWIDDTTSGYPNYELVRQLMEVPNIKEGTIIQYSQFEQYALKTIRKELKRELNLVQDAPVLIDWLNAIVQRHDSNHHSPPYLADLSRLVKSYYYNSNMGHSLSIKDVLQSILTVSKTLKHKYRQPYQSTNYDEIIWWQWDEHNACAKNPYDILKNRQRTGIGRGTEALVSYAKLLTGSFNEEKKAQMKESLLKYCELDTLAMLMIYEHWKGLEPNRVNSLSLGT